MKERPSMESMKLIVRKDFVNEKHCFICKGIM